ncbi:hypothetical protein [Sphingobacterium kyonggiense]
MGFLTLEEIETFFIDDRNRDLWGKLFQTYTIGVNDDYSFYKLDFVSEDEVVYVLTDSTHNKNLFTHELLHLDLRFKGFNSLLAFPHLILPNGNLVESQESMIISSICNCVEHILFFDEYIELGFEQDQFVADYYTSEHPEAIFTELAHVRSNDIGINYNNLFIARQLIILAEEYCGLERENHLKRLSNLDLRMYNKGIDLFNHIIDFEIKEEENNDNQVRFNDLILSYINF